MYSLATIIHINAAAASAPKAETEATRHCSFHKSKAGIVLHSARLRSTAFIEGKAAQKRFEVEMLSTNSQVKKDGIIESYFASAPTGKRRLRS